MKRKLVFILSITILLLITACTEGTNEESSSGSGDDNTTNKDDLVIGFESDASTLLSNTDVDYVTSTQLENIYDTLIDRDGNTGELNPGLATEWESIDDLTWHFKLEEGVKFHNGAEFDAEAVKFNIDYILDKANNSAYRSRWTAVEEVNVLSTYEVEIITSEPHASLLEYISSDLLIMEPGNIEELGIEEASKNPVGTGAYKFVEWSRDNHLKLESFDDYWRGTPEIKNLEFRYIPEFSSRLSAIVSGEIDLFKNVPVDSVDQIENDDGLKIEEASSSRINYLALNTFHDGPLQNVEVRQALNYAVDVDEILDTILSGYGQKIIGPLSSINEGYVETKEYEYDPDKAVEMIKEAGYDPEDMTLSLDTPSGRYPMDTHFSQAIASQLQRIGIEVDVQVNEWGAHLEKAQNREMGDMYIMGWGPAFTAQSTIENLFTEDAPYSSFYDEEIEELIYKTAGTFDEDQRFDGFAEIQEMLVEQASWVPLWQQADLYAVKENLEFEARVDEKILAFEMSWK